MDKKTSYFKHWKNYSKTWQKLGFIISKYCVEFYDSNGNKLSYNYQNKDFLINEKPVNNVGD